jgi:hypothetical protein
LIASLVTVFGVLIIAGAIFGYWYLRKRQGGGESEPKPTKLSKPSKTPAKAQIYQVPDKDDTLATPSHSLMNTSSSNNDIAMSSGEPEKPNVDPERLVSTYSHKLNEFCLEIVIPWSCIRDQAATILQ